MMKKKLFKISLAGIFSALATLTFILESLFPPIILPGARMGLSNIFILLSLILLGPIESVFVLLIKTLIGSLFSGNISSIIYSIPAGLISLSVEILAIYFIKKVSVISISVLGAIINVTIQNIVFCLVTKTMEYFVFIPYLSLISAVSGLIVGFTVYLIIKKLPEKHFKNLQGEQN